MPSSFLPSRVLDHGATFGIQTTNVPRAVGTQAAAAKLLGISRERAAQIIAESNGDIGFKHKAAYTNRRKDKGAILQELKGAKMNKGMMKRLQALRAQHPDWNFQQLAEQAFRNDIAYLGKKGKLKKGPQLSNKPNPKADGGKKSKNKHAKRARLSMIQAAYTAIPEGASPKKMTAWGNLLTFILKNPYNMGGNKATVFQLTEFHPNLDAAVVVDAQKNADAFCMALYTTIAPFLLEYNNGGRRYRACSALEQYQPTAAKFKTSDLFSRVATAFNESNRSNIDLSKHQAHVKDFNIAAHQLSDLSNISNVDRAQRTESYLVTAFKCAKYVKFIARPLNQSFAEYRAADEDFANTATLVAEAYNKEKAADGAPVTPALIKENFPHVERLFIYEANINVFNLTYRLLQKLVYITRNPHHAAILRSFHDTVMGLWDPSEKVREAALKSVSVIEAYIGEYTKKLKASTDSAQIGPRITAFLAAVAVGTYTFGDLLCNTDLRNDATTQKKVWNALCKGALTDPIVTSSEFKNDFTLERKHHSWQTNRRIVRTTASCIRQNIIARGLRRRFAWFQEDNVPLLKNISQLVQKSRNFNFLIEHYTQLGTPAPQGFQQIGVAAFGNAYSLFELPVNLYGIPATDKAEAKTYGWSRVSLIANILGFGSQTGDIKGYGLKIPSTTLPDLAQCFSVIEQFKTDPTTQTRIDREKETRKAMAQSVRALWSKTGTGVNKNKGGGELSVPDYDPDDEIEVYQQNADGMWDAADPSPGYGGRRNPSVLPAAIGNNDASDVPAAIQDVVMRQENKRNRDDAEIPEDRQQTEQAEERDLAAAARREAEERAAAERAAEVAANQPSDEFTRTGPNSPQDEDSDL